MDRYRMGQDFMSEAQERIRKATQEAYTYLEDDIIAMMAGGVPLSQIVYTEPHTKYLHDEVTIQYQIGCKH